MKKLFKAGGLPHNSYAMANLAYFTQKDIQYFQKISTSKGPLFVEIKGFILKAEELNDKLPDGEVGLSSF